MEHEKKKQGLIMGIIMVIAGAGILVWSLNRIADNNDNEADTEVVVTDNSATDSNDEAEVEVTNQGDEVSEPAEDTVSYSHRAELPDVTNGVTIQGINTAGNAGGVAQSVFNDGTYMLFVEFSNLPEPVNDSFYEGWLVEKGTTSFFSTGVVEKDENGVYIDTFTDTTDWNQSHTFYVLTLEPNDGDPAPADHIVEEVLTPVQ